IKIREPYFFSFFICIVVLYNLIITLHAPSRKIIMQWIFFLHRELSTLPEMDRAFINVLMITNMGLWELEKLNVIHLSLGKMMTIGSKIYKNFKMTLSKMTLSCVLQREYLGLVLDREENETTFRDTLSLDSFIYNQQYIILKCYVYVDKE
ncbi:hypothetical protein ACJX0J_042552, partial [Zea mays]